MIKSGTKLDKNYQPKGTRFKSLNWKMMMVLTNEPQKELHGWILIWSKGRWVTFRKATDFDIREINQAVSDAHHAEHD